MDAHEWDDRYRAAGGSPRARLWSALPAEVFRDTVSRWPPGRALDLATGDGRNAIWLAREGWSVTALDFSAEAIRLARKHARDARVNVTWLIADAAIWSPGEQFDLVSILYLHLPAPALRSALTRAAQWVAPGGHLVVLGHDRTNPETGAPGPTNPDILYSPELLRSVVSPSRIIRCETIRRDLSSDPEAAGTSGGYALDTVLIASA